MMTLRSFALAVASLLFACGAEAQTAKPAAADAGLSLKARASRPTCPTGRSCAWLKTDGSLQLSTGTNDVALAKPGTEITVALVQSFAPTTLATASVYSVTYYIPSDVTIVYAQLGLRAPWDYVAAGPNGLGSDTANMKIAGCAPSVDRQSCTGTQTTFTGITVPAFQLSAKQALPVTVDASRYMMFRYTAPSGSSWVEYVTNAGQGGGFYTIANSQDVTAPSGWSATAAPVGQLVVTYNTSRPKLVIWSDSIPRGIAGTGEGGLNYAYAGLGPLRDYAVAAIGVATTTAATWAGDTDWMLGDTSAVVDANVFIALGTNDLQAGTSAVNLIRYTKQLVTKAKALGGKRLIVGTIPSSTTYSGPQETERLLYNAYLRAKPGWIDDVFDVDALVGTAAQHPTYFATGGIHLTATAYSTVLLPAFPTLY